jgi:hypothetical protein
MRRMVLIAVVVVALAAVTGGIAIAAGGGDDGDGDGRPITGNALSRASVAALAHTGGGRVTATEAGDEEGAYEVEVTLDNGKQVDVHLDTDFNVLGGSADNESGADADNESGADANDTGNDAGDD